MTGRTDAESGRGRSGWRRAGLSLVALAFAMQASCVGTSNGPIPCVISGGSPQFLATTPGRDLRDVYVFSLLISLPSASFATIQTSFFCGEISTRLDWRDARFVMTCDSPRSVSTVTCGIAARVRLRAILEFTIKSGT